MRSLMQSMSHLLFIHSIDDINKKESSNHQDLDVEKPPQILIKAFDYNDLPIEEIATKRMPYFNYNSHLFDEYRVDWNNLLIIKEDYLDNVIIENNHENNREISFNIKNPKINKTMIFKENIKNIERGLTLVLLNIRKFTFYEENQGREIIQYILPDQSAIEDELCYKCKDVTKDTSPYEKAFKVCIFKFLEEIESYIDGLSSIDVFNVFFGLRPSRTFNTYFSRTGVGFTEFKEFMDKIYIIYERVRCYIQIDLDISNVKNDDSDHYINHWLRLKRFILLKWENKVSKNSISNIANRMKRPNHMLVYSININNILFEELDSIVEKVTSAKSDEEIKLLGLSKIKLPNRIYETKHFIFYQFSLTNNKSYVIKVSDLVNFNEFPFGLSTAYLNCKGGFESLGFLATTNHSYRRATSHLFLSIEEAPSFYLSTNLDFNVFKSNAIQTFYFVLHILELLNSFTVYKIGLSGSYHTPEKNNIATGRRIIGSPKPKTDFNFYLTFGVDSSSYKKW